MSAIFYKDKVYGAGGSGGGGGASAISDLTDVDLDNLSDGQILKWNDTTQKWENADESGGGGSTVTITPTLSQGTKIADFSIDDQNGELYAPQGSGYSETTLFTGTYQTFSGEITLDDDLDNYDLVIFWTRWTATSTNCEVPFVANAKYFVSQFPYDNGSTAQTSPHMGLTTYYNQYLRVKMGSANNKLFLFDAHSIALAKVTGIKFDGSGGGSGSYERTELFKSSDENAVWNASGIELSDDISNYDELEIVMGYSNAATDKSRNSLRYDAKWFAQTFPYISDANANPHALCLLWASQGFSCGWDSANQKIRMWGRNGTAAIWAVYGIKV